MILKFFLVIHQKEGKFFIVTSRLLLLPQRLYREDYHKQKDKIHTTYDTPDIKQVKMNQEHLSDVRDPQRRSWTLVWFLLH